MAKPRRRARVIAATVVVSLALSLVAAEFVFRMFEPRPYEPGAFYTESGQKAPLTEIVHFLQRHELPREHTGPSGRLTPDMRVKQGYDRPKWDYFDAQGCITVEHNSLGFRDREFPVQKPAGEYRVMALGDSFTYGSGAQVQDTWPKVLERLLQQRRKEPVLVINGGFACGSHTPAGFDAWMETDGLAFGPDLVIVGLCLNDMAVGNDVPMLGYPAVSMQLGGVSHLLNYVQKLAEQRALRAQPAPDFAAIVRARPATWEATQNGLRALNARLASKNVPLVVAVLPMVSQLEDPAKYPYAPLHTMVVDFCREAGIRCVDLQDCLLGRRDEDLWAHPTDQHPNHVGHRLLAEGLDAWLARERLGP